MVAGDRFMQEQVLRVPGLAGRQVVGVDVEDAGARTILAGRHVAAAGGGLGTVRFHRADLERRLGHQRELLGDALVRSEEHKSELQSLMRRSYAVVCVKKEKT